MRHSMRYWDVSYERTGSYHASVSLKRYVVVHYHYYYRVRRDVLLSYLIAASPHLAFPAVQLTFWERHGELRVMAPEFST